MLQEHDRAILTVDLPDHQLQVGDIGTVVHIYNGGNAYEVEFLTVDGQTLDVITVEAAQLREVQGSEILHARPLVVQ